MSTFKITSSAGVDLGTYEGETAADALDAMARDAGYPSQAAAVADGVAPFDGTVVEVTDGQIEDLQMAAGSAGDIMQAAICAVALGGETGEYPLSDAERARLATFTAATARAECARVIADAAAL